MSTMKGAPMRASNGSNMETESVSVVGVEADDLFADLRKQRYVSEQTERILSYGPAMMRYRSEGVTWKQLAARLERVGIKVSPEYLRALMDRHAASIEVAPKTAARKAMPPTLAIRRKRTPRVTRETEEVIPGLPGALQKSETTGRQPGDGSVDLSEPIKKYSSVPVRHAGDRFLDK